MADDIQLNAATTTGDKVRAVQKGGASGPKSNAVVLDLGGAGAESLMAAGQQTKAGSVPVALASDQILPVGHRTDALYNGTAANAPQSAPIAAGASGDGNVIVAAQAGKSIKVLYWLIVLSNAVNVKFRDFDGTSAYADLTGVMNGVQNQPLKSDYCPVGHFSTQAGHALTLNLSGAVAVGGYVVYVAE